MSLLDRLFRRSKRKESVRTDYKRANIICSNCGAEYYHEFMAALETINLDKVTFSTSEDPQFAFGKCQFCGAGLKPKGKSVRQIDLKKRN